MNRDRFCLTDSRLAPIEPHLPKDRRDKPHVDDRRVISGIVQVFKSGRRCRLEDFRRIATRYDRNAANFLAAVCIAATVS